MSSNNCHTNLTFHHNEKHLAYDSIELPNACNLPNATQNESVKSKVENKDTEVKWKIWKNMLIISSGFTFLFLAFVALNNIESSLYPENGLGTNSLGVFYIFYIISSLFLPRFFIQHMGVKWTMVVTCLFHSTYIGANMYGTWWTLIPTCILAGLAAGPIWTAKAIYVTELSKKYALLTRRSSKDTIAFFFGIFFTMFKIGPIFGNFISSLVLGGYKNITISDEQLKICGVKYCNELFPYSGPSSEQSESAKTESVISNKNTLYLLIGIYLASSILAAFLMALFLDPLDQTDHQDQILQQSGCCHNLMATLVQMKNLKQILLIPLSIFIGLELGFISGDFTRSMITCSMGIQNIGYILSTHYIVNALSSMLSTLIVKRIGRVAVLTFAIMCNAAVITAIYYWLPDPNKIEVFFILAILWGIADGTWQPQILAFYGNTFKEDLDAAYSNQCLWLCIGNFISYATSNYLCMVTKLWILSTFLTLAAIGYYATEIIIHKKQRCMHCS